MWNELRRSRLIENDRGANDRRADRICILEFTMTDRVPGQADNDRNRINLAEDYELSFWKQQFGVTAEQLAMAVKKAGPSAHAVSMLLMR